MNRRRFFKLIGAAALAPLALAEAAKAGGAEGIRMSSELLGDVYTIVRLDNVTVRFWMQRGETHRQLADRTMAWCAANGVPVPKEIPCVLERKADGSRKYGSKKVLA